MTLTSKYIYTTVLLLVSFSIVQGQTKNIDSLLFTLQVLPEDTNRVNCLNELAANYGAISVVKVIEAARTALALAKEIHYERGMAEAYGYLGTAYADAGNYTMAIQYLLNGLRIAEQRNDMREVARDYHDIGGVYVSDGKFKKGIQYYRKAVEIWERIGNKRGPVTALYNIGNAYQQQNEDSQAMYYYRKTINQGMEIGRTDVVLFSYVNVGAIYLKQKNYTAAEHFCNEAFKLASANDTNNNVLAEIYGIYSEVYLAQHKPKQALASIKKAITIAESSGKGIYMLQNYKRMADIYRHTGNITVAYDVLSRYTMLSDSLKSASEKASFAQMVNAYELEKKDMQLAAQGELHKADMFSRNAFIGLLLCLLLFVLLKHNRTKLILAARGHQLKYYTNSLVEKSMIVSSISEELKQLKSGTTDADENMEKFGRMLQLKIHTEEEWENFKHAFEEVYPHFFNNLRYKYPGITASELRLAAITKLNLSIKEAAAMLGISKESVKQSRYRLKKRIGVPEDLTLKDFLEVSV